MILAFDSSAVTASAALCEKDTVIRSEFVNAGLTHSESLLPMIKRVMGDVPFSSLDGIAVTNGPGSFTGVRIGVATAKGLAFDSHVPCIPLSTLEAIAYNFIDENCVVCAVMDARRMQFYNALFRMENGKCERLTPDRAIALDDLREELRAYEKIVIAGDGAVLCYDNIGLTNCRLADEPQRFQNAVSVAKAAQHHTAVAASELVPLYLRQSQAERELKLKLK